MTNLFTGPTAVAFGEDAIMSARILSKFAKDNENLGYGKYMKNVEPLLSKIISNIEPDLPQSSKKALYEVSALLKKKVVEIDDVAKMSEFSGFFGREQCYLSMTNE